MTYHILSISIIKKNQLNSLVLPLQKHPKPKSYFWTFLNLMNNQELHRLLPKKWWTLQLTQCSYLNKRKNKRWKMKMMMKSIPFLNAEKTKTTVKMMRFQPAKESVSKKKKLPLKKQKTKKSKRSFLQCLTLLKKSYFSKSNKLASRTLLRHSWRLTRDSRLENNSTSTTTISMRINTTTKSAMICPFSALKILLRKISKGSTENSRSFSLENNTTITRSKQLWEINSTGNFLMISWRPKLMNGSNILSLRTKTIWESSLSSCLCAMMTLIILFSLEITINQRMSNQLELFQNEKKNELISSSDNKSFNSNALST